MARNVAALLIGRPIPVDRCRTVGVFGGGRALRVLVPFLEPNPTGEGYRKDTISSTLLCQLDFRNQAAALDHLLVISRAIHGVGTRRPQRVVRPAPLRRIPAVVGGGINDPEGNAQATAAIDLYVFTVVECQDRNADLREPNASVFSLPCGRRRCFDE